MAVTDKLAKKKQSKPKVTIHQFDYHSQFPVVDYHDFSHRGTTKEKRAQLNIGDMYLNAVICHDCDYFIRSRNRHDMVHCKCGNTYVDGGSLYQRRGGKNCTSIIEMYEDAKS